MGHSENVISMLRMDSFEMVLMSEEVELVVDPNGGFEKASVRR